MHVAPRPQSRGHAGGQTWPKESLLTCTRQHKQSQRDISHVQRETTHKRVVSPNTGTTNARQVVNLPIYDDDYYWSSSEPKNGAGSVEVRSYTSNEFDEPSEGSDEYSEVSNATQEPSVCLDELSED